MTAAVAAVRVPVRSWHSELRAVRTVWRRDLLRFRKEPMGIVSWLLQPLLFLFVLGPGLGSLTDGADRADLTTFLFPGVICMALVYSGMFSAASMVWDRELGFLRELLVAPVARSSILAGKCLGGATIAAGQGVLVLALAGLAGVPYEPTLLLGMLGLVLLLALAVTAFGLLVAVSIRQARTFTSVMQLLVIPMLFLSGALFPVTGLPGWLAVLNRVNPLTYGVDAMRRLVVEHVDDRVPVGVTWWGWEVPLGLEVAAVAVLGAGLLALAVVRFRRAD